MMKRIRLLCLVLVAPTVLAVACSKPDRRPVVATAGGGATPSATPSLSTLQQALRWTQCMRQHGVPMLDPDANGDPRGADGSKGSIDPATVNAAQQACEQYQPVLSGPDADARLQVARAYSKCMRDHGVEAYPDPDANGRVTLPDDVTDPDFDRAKAFCDAQQRAGRTSPGADR